MGFTALGAHIYAGGHTLGTERHFEVLAHFEDGYKAGIETAKLNWPDMPVFEKPWPAANYADETDYVYCNPPCAIFSATGIRTTRGADAWRVDPRRGCWYDCFGLLDSMRPRALSIESVTQAYSTGREMIDELTKLALIRGYSVTHVMVNAAWLGVPQKRKRFFFVAHRPSVLAYSTPNWAPPTTVGECLAEVLGGDEPIAQILDRHAEAVRATRPGEGLREAWERLNPPETAPLNHLGHVKDRPSFNEHRLDPTRPMGALIGNFYIHPSEDRRLTPSELKALCGFPDDFQLWGPPAHWASLLARGVMPPVAAWLAESVRRTLERDDGAWSDRTVRLLDIREPGREIVDLTPSYLDQNGRVRLRLRADGSIGSAPIFVSGTPVVAPVAPPLAAPSPVAAPVVRVEDTAGLPSARQRAPEAHYNSNQAITLAAADSSDGDDSHLRPMKGEGSGRFMQRLWLDTTLSPDEIVALVHRNWEGRTTKRSDMYYNYKKLVDAGTIVRPWSTEGRTRRSEKASDARQVESHDAPDSGLVLLSITGSVDGQTETPPQLPQSIPPPPSVKRTKATTADRSDVVPDYRGEVDRALVYFGPLPTPEEKPNPVSSVRMAWFLRDELKPDVVYSESFYPTDVLPARIGELWVVNSSWTWMRDEWRCITMRLFSRADRVVFCQNDYKMYLHSYHVGRIREDANHVVLTTCPHLSIHQKHDVAPELVNWNALTYIPRPESDVERQRGVYYYGSMRDGRFRIFDQYFSDPSPLLTVSASSGTELRKFRQTFPRLNSVPRCDNVFVELERWAATLLLEDERATREYVSPPNRFYEALSSRCPLVFDASSIQMFKRYGYDVTPFVIRRPSDLDESLIDRVADWGERQAAWQRDHVGELRQQFHDVNVRLHRGECGRTGPPPGLKRYAFTEEGGDR